MGRITLNRTQAFQKEIKKQFKQDIPLSDRKDWRNKLENDKNQIQLLNSQLASEEKKLNTLVYKLFKLDSDEIQLLEENIH